MTKCLPPKYASVWRSSAWPYVTRCATSSSMLTCTNARKIECTCSTVSITRAIVGNERSSCNLSNDRTCVNRPTTSPSVCTPSAVGKRLTSAAGDILADGVCGEVTKDVFSVLFFDTDQHWHTHGSLSCNAAP